MFPRSGGEKVYLEAVYKYPKFLITMVFAFNAIFLGFTGTSLLRFLWKRHLDRLVKNERRRLISVLASGCIVFASNIVLASVNKILGHRTMMMSLAKPLNLGQTSL